MPNVAISEWLGLIELEVAEVSEPLVQRALLDALQKFCQDSKIWRETLSPNIDSVAGTTTYTPKTPDGSRLAGIRRMEYDGNKVIGHGEEWLDDALAQDWRTQTAITPKYYYQERPDQFTLVFGPSSTIAAAIFLRAYLKPSMLASEVPDFLFEDERYRVSIEAGAKESLFRMIGTVWADAEAAARWGSIFQMGIEEARGHAEKDHTEEIMLITTAPFGGIT